MSKISRDEVIRRLCIITRHVANNLDAKFSCTCGQDKTGDEHMDEFDDEVLSFVEMAVFEKIESRRPKCQS